MRDALTDPSLVDLCEDDLVARGPARASRRKKAAVRPDALLPTLEDGPPKRTISSALKQPGRILAAFILSGVGAIIAYNALMLQKTRHPAPLFGRTVTSMQIPAPPPLPRPVASAQASIAPLVQAPEPLAPAVPIPASAAAAPSPAAGPHPPHSAIAELIHNGGVVKPPVPPARATMAGSAPATAAPAAADPIADMIRLAGPVPVPPASVPATSNSANLTLPAQRALVKLGYVVKADGMTSPAFRQAIESFERDRHLPVTGELGPRTLHELAAQSGLPIS